MTLQQTAQEQLRQLVEQIERLEEEKAAIADDVKDKFAEAKALGFDAKIIKMVIRIRKKPRQVVEEEESILHTYLHALGMGMEDEERGEAGLH